MLDLFLLKKYFLQNEGWRPICYPDSLGIPTVGVGFDLTRKDARFLIKGLGLDYYSVLEKKTSLNPDQIMHLFNLDVNYAISQTRRVFPNLNMIDSVRQIILIDMVYNMGSVVKFPNMIIAVNKAAISKKQEYWDTAADEMEYTRAGSAKYSLWFTQVGFRGKNNVKAMKTGIMPIIQLKPEETAALIYLH